MTPTIQVGRIVAGSPTVLIGGQPARPPRSTCPDAATPGQLVARVRPS